MFDDVHGGGGAPILLDQRYDALFSSTNSMNLVNNASVKIPGLAMNTSLRKFGFNPRTKKETNRDSNSCQLDFSMILLQRSSY